MKHKLLIVLGTFLLFFSLGLSINKTAQAKSIYVYTKAKNLNVYTSNKKDYETIMDAYGAMFKTANAKAKTWIKISDNGKKYIYVRSKDVTTKTIIVKSAPKKKSSTKGSRYTNKTTKLYSKTTGTKYIKALLANAKVTLYSTSGKRLKVKYAGKTGYILKSALSKSTKSIVLYSNSLNYTNKYGQHVINDKVYTHSYLGSTTYKLTDGRNINKKYFKTRPLKVTVIPVHGSYYYGGPNGYLLNSDQIHGIKYMAVKITTTGAVRRLSKYVLLFSSKGWMAYNSSILSIQAK